MIELLQITGQGLLDSATADGDNPCQHSQWLNHQYLRISNRINNTVLQRVIDWLDSGNTYDRMWTILLHSFDFINFSRLFIWVSLLLLLLFYQSRARAFYLLVVGTAALTQTQQSSWLTWTRTPSELPTHSPCWLLVHYFHMFVRSSIAPKPSQSSSSSLPATNYAENRNEQHSSSPAHPKPNPPLPLCPFLVLLVLHLNNSISRA